MRERSWYVGGKYLRKVLLVTLLLPLLIATVSANVDLDVEPVTNTIGANQPAQFNVTVENEFSENKSVRLSLSPANTLSWTLTPTIIRAPAQSNTSQIITIKQRRFNRGAFGLDLYGEVDDTEFQERLRITVSPEAVTGFPLSVSLDLFMSDEIDPRQPTNIEVKVRNRNPRDIEDLRITVNSDLFSEGYNIGLEPRGENSREFTYDFPNDVQPGVYTILLQATDPETEETIVTSRKNMRILSYSNVTENQESDWSFFKTDYEVTVMNDGNVPVNHTITKDFNMFERFFLSSDDTYQVIERNNQNQVSWDVSLSPQEERTVTFSTNYRLLAILLLIMIIGVGAYYKLRSPVVMVKGALVRKKDEESRELKVRIFVRNRSNKPVYNIRISDKAPKITEFQKPKEVGSLKPSKVTRSSNKGTKIFWDIDKLEPQEERILSYKAMSKLPIIGNISLEPARAKFEEENGRERTTISSTKNYEK